METNLDFKIDEAWNEALANWNNPSVPHVIAPATLDEIEKLGNVGRVLSGQLAFMKYPEFQVYQNLGEIAKVSQEDPVRGVKAVSKHELGHRFCPYDTVTSIILRHAIKQELDKKKLPYSSDSASNLVLNLFTDMCINTTLARKGDEDLPWLYGEISKDKKKGKLWNVYARSMEIAWDKKLLPEKSKLNDKEQEAAKAIAELFERDFFDRTKWRDNAGIYASIIGDFLENEGKDKGASLDDSSENIPKTLDEKTERELAKKLSEIGSDGLPTNPEGLKEFKEIMAGFGKGDPIEASITFYDRLSESYNVMFATRPFGRPRVNPFEPIKWTPGMSPERMDINYSIGAGGRIVPYMNTYTWNTRKRDAQGGLEEVVPDLDLYLDSSGSMPNPIDQISLPVLAGFVAAKKAHRKGARIRSTNYSGKNQSETQDWTRDLNLIFRNLVVYYNGGTVFPTSKLLEGDQPRQVLVITDTFLANETETADAIKELRKRHPQNKVSIYALHPVDRADYLRTAGAEVILGTTTDIFKKAIGKANEVYVR